MKIISIFATLIIAFAGFFSVEANAARIESVNIVYFDSNHYPIGQHGETCNNVHWEGGQQGGLYSLQVVSGCGGDIMDCGYNWHGTYETFDCDKSGSYTSSTARLMGDWIGANLEDACDTTGVCGLNPPEKVQGWGFTFHQTYP